MSKAIEAYLDRVMTYANRRAEDAQRIRAEQHDHLMEKFERFKKDGIPPEDAVFQAIRDHGDARIVGYRLRPRFPLIDIRAYGTARGIIAIGPRAVGVVAFGGCAVGLLFTWAGMGVGGIAYAGLAIGFVAVGGVALGVIAWGGVGAGLWVPGAGQVFSYYTKQSAPSWMRQFDAIAASPELYMKFTLFFLPILILSIVVPAWLQRREYQRVRSAETSVAM